MAAESSCQNIIIHILDANDNIPYFVQNEYVGALSESAAIGSYVLKVHDSSKEYVIVFIPNNVDYNIIFCTSVI